MPGPIVIASMMREHGETGVQTHVRAVRDWLVAQGRNVRLVTPFSNSRALVYPVFAVRRLIDRLHKPSSVKWYRHWHAVFLRRALRRQLAGGEPCVVYAQCWPALNSASRFLNVLFCNWFQKPSSRVLTWPKISSAPPLAASR